MGLLGIRFPAVSNVGFDCRCFRLVGSDVLVVLPVGLAGRTDGSLGGFTCGTGCSALSDLSSGGYFSALPKLPLTCPTRGGNNPSVWQSFRAPCRRLDSCKMLEGQGPVRVCPGPVTDYSQLYYLGRHKSGGLSNCFSINLVLCHTVYIRLIWFLWACWSIARSRRHHSHQFHHSADPWSHLLHI